MKTIKEVIENLLEENYQLEKQNKKLKSQRDYWEKEYYEVVDENDKQDEFIKQLNQQNYTLQNELFTAYLHQQHQKELISELKTALSSYNNFVDEMFPD